MTERKPIDYYLGLKYPVTVQEDPDGGYVAKILDLPGCLTQGETIEETFKNINEVRELWIKTAYEHGDPIWEPSDPPQRSRMSHLPDLNDQLDRIERKAITDKATLMIKSVETALAHGTKHYHPVTHSLLPDVRSILACLKNEGEIVVEPKETSP